MELGGEPVHLLLAGFDEGREHLFLATGSVGEGHNGRLLRARGNNDWQLLDHLAADVEDVGAGSGAAQVFLGRGLIDLPGEEGGIDGVGADADHEEVGGADAWERDVVEGDRVVARTSGGKDDVASGEEVDAAGGGELDVGEALPVYTEVGVDVAHLDDAGVAGREFVDGRADGVAGGEVGDGGEVEDFFCVNADHAILIYRRNSPMSSLCIKVDIALRLPPPRCDFHVAPV